MQYNFDEVIDRYGTSSVKYDLVEKVFGRNDVTPMWVADMDFKAPQFILDAIKKRCEHPVLGYTFGSDNYFKVVIDWLKKHYDISAEKHELHYVPGIVAGISFCLQAFTEPGDKILVMNPVYPPFIKLPKNNGRNLLVNELQLVDNQFVIDFEDFERKAKGCKMFILSNPHNPGGRVWSEEELNRMADICYDNNVIVISDEIHADLTLHGFKHHSFASISQKAKDISITFIAPSKTFNIAGLATSIAYINNAELRNTLFSYLDNYEIANGNVFAYLGAEVAFCREGEIWLAQLKDYIAKNVTYVDEFFKKNLPLVKPILPQASFLVWLDFRGLNISHQQLVDRLINVAKVGLNNGLEFGDNYSCFMRMNIGCPTEKLASALDRIALSLNS